MWVGIKLFGTAHMEETVYRKHKKIQIPFHPLKTILTTVTSTLVVTYN